MSRRNSIIPIYTSKGEAAAYLSYPHLYNCAGDWIGIVTAKREVYSIYGTYVGWLSDDPRILRKRVFDFNKQAISMPPDPGRIDVPVLSPLAPLMPEIGFGTVDILLEEPDRLPTQDCGDLKEDLD